MQIRTRRSLQGAYDESETDRSGDVIDADPIAAVGGRCLRGRNRRAGGPVAIRKRRRGRRPAAWHARPCSLPRRPPQPAAEKAKQKTDDLAGRPAGATDPNDPRLAWYREAKFGLFIHWGLYAVPAGTWKGKQIEGIGEWIMNRAKIPVKEYEQLAKQFNPVKFNADEWAQMAQDAGMKYITITAKHHDGFAMFASTGEQVQHRRRHALPSRPHEGTGPGLRKARNQALLLLLAGPGLARAGRDGKHLGLRHGQGEIGQRRLRQVHRREGPPPGAGNPHPVRPDRTDLVRYARAR